MQHKKLLALIAALLCLSMLFMACAKEDTEPPAGSDNPPADVPATDPVTDLVEEPKLLDSFLNPDWTYTPNRLASIQKLDIQGNVVSTNATLLILANNSGEQTVTYVYNMTTGNVVATFTDTQENKTVENVDIEETVNYYVVANTNSYSSNSNSFPGFLVLTVQQDSTMQYDSTFHSDFFHAYDDIRYSAICTIDVYGSDGTKVQTIDNKTIKHALRSNYTENPDSDLDDWIQSYIYTRKDLLVVGDRVYRADKDGVLTFVKEFTMSSVPFLDGSINGYYYYYSWGIRLYDAQLNPILCFDVPNSADDYEFYPLSNGNILLQYSMQLPYDATEYDYYEIVEIELDDEDIYITCKYDLTTVLLATDGTITELDFNYIIDDIDPVAVDEDEDNRYYNESIQNIAYLCPINEQKQMDTRYTKEEYVALTNEGTIAFSLMFIDYQYGEIDHYGDGIYIAKNNFGQYLVLDRDGNILNILDSNKLISTLNYRYFISETAILNTKGEVVYDLLANNITNIIRSNDTAILISETQDEDGYDVTTYYLFANGTAIRIGQEDHEGEWRIILDLFESFGLYYTEEEQDSKTVYTYYNAAGKLMGTFDSAIVEDLNSLNDNMVGMGYSGFIVCDSDQNLYQFKYN